MNAVGDKIKALLADLQAQGVPMLMLKDVQTKQPSVTFTMLVVSFILSVCAANNFLSSHLGGLNFENYFQLTLAAVGVYIGRRFQKGNITVDSNNPSTQGQ